METIRAAPELYELQAGTEPALYFIGA